MLAPLTAPCPKLALELDRDVGLVPLGGDAA
jgi:hypothetical protein